jgi:hypothetical protein
MRLWLLGLLAVTGCTSPSYRGDRDAGDRLIDEAGNGEVDASTAPSTPREASAPDHETAPDYPTVNGAPCTVNVSRIGECAL